MIADTALRSSLLSILYSVLCCSPTLMLTCHLICTTPAEGHEPRIPPGHPTGALRALGDMRPTRSHIFSAVVRTRPGRRVCCDPRLRVLPMVLPGKWFPGGMAAAFCAGRGELEGDVEVEAVDVTGEGHLTPSCSGWTCGFAASSLDA